MPNTMRISRALLVAGLTCGFGVALGVPSASAMPTAHYPALATDSGSYQPAAWVYVSGKHGPRYKAKRAGFGYYYGGYWYRQPWWTIAVGPVGVGPVVVYNSKIHGPRYHSKHAGYIYHNGYWYKHRWW